MAKANVGDDQVTRELPPLSMRATIRPGSVDIEKRTFDVIWTTGARVLRGFWDQHYEELSLDPKHVRMQRLNNGAPLLESHDGYRLGSVLGVVEPGSAKLDGKQGTATVRFAKAEDDPEADKVFRKVVDGIIQNLSVGYRTFKMEKIVSGEGEIPVMRAVDWEPYELSVVAMGADDGAGFRSATDRAPNQCVIVGAPIPEQEKRNMENTEIPAKPGSAAPLPPVTEDATRAAELATKVERDRSTGIRTMVRRAKLGDALADDLVGKGFSLDAARAVVLDKLATAGEKTPTEQHVRIEAGEDESDKFRSGASAWLFAKAGATSIMERAQKAMPSHAAFNDVALDPGEFRGLSLLDLARESLERAGVKTRGMQKMDLVGSALTQRSHGMNSTSDFAAILENTLHKLLLASYGVTPDSWSIFCLRGSVSDFRPHNRYRLGSFGALDSLNEHGELIQKSIPDAEKQSISASTKGNIISLSRQAIINDDMAAFSRLATMLGRAAKLSIELDVYALLALNAGLGPTMSDALTLFHATHANVGVGAALSSASVAADSVVLASQKDPAKNEILDLRPSVLVVPKAIGPTARVINEAQYDPDTANKLQRPNYSRGMFEAIVDTARLAGTRQYLFADPGVAPVIEVAFLDGQSEPFLDVMNGWRVDGVDWKVRLDYGVGAIDFRGAVTNAGV